MLRRQQTVVTAQDANGFPTAFVGGFGDGADDRVKTGTISAASDDADFHSWNSNGAKLYRLRRQDCHS